MILLGKKYFKKKTLDRDTKRIYNNTMMKTLHTSNQPTRLDSWLANYCSEKFASIDGTVGVSGEEVKL